MRLPLSILALLALSACRSTPTDTPAEPGQHDTPIAEPDTGTPVAGPSEVQLSALGDKQLSVSVGATLTYSFKSHASVGLGATQEIADQGVIRYVRTDTAFEQSEAERVGKTGADAATGTFVFEAVGPGTTTLTINEQFRGSTEVGSTFTITVEPTKP